MVDGVSGAAIDTGQARLLSVWTAVNPRVIDMDNLTAAHIALGRRGSGLERHGIAQGFEIQDRVHKLLLRVLEPLQGGLGISGHRHAVVAHPLIGPGLELIDDGVDDWVATHLAESTKISCVPPGRRSAGVGGKGWPPSGREWRNSAVSGTFPYPLRTFGICNLVQSSPGGNLFQGQRRGSPGFERFPGHLGRYV